QKAASLPPGQANANDVPGPSTEVREVLSVPAAARTADQLAVLKKEFQKVDPERMPLDKQLDELKKRKQQIAKAITSTLVLHERAKPRETHIHVRGDFLHQGVAVQPGVPAVLPSIKPRGAAADRLDFARWLVDVRQPLTPRVTANRVWQIYFGQGLV